VARHKRLQDLPLDQHTRLPSRTERAPPTTTIAVACHAENYLLSLYGAPANHLPFYCPLLFRFGHNRLDIGLRRAAAHLAFARVYTARLWLRASYHLRGSPLRHTARLFWPMPLALPRLLDTARIMLV